MNLAVLPGAALHSVITIGDRAGAEPQWQSMFDWYSGEAHVGLAADTLAQRNLFGVELDRAVARADRAVLLVASGVGCVATAWWARLSPANYVSRVAGALLFAPQRDGLTIDDRERFASPRIHLPFPSIVIDDSTLPLDRSRSAELAQGWGSRLLDGREPASLTDRSHDESISPWLQVQRIVRRWSASVVAHDARVAEALAGRRSLSED